jgi:competence protein ComEA
MKTRKIERFLKEYFYFSQTERRGIIGLLVLLIFIIALPSLYGWVFPPPSFEYKIETLQSSSGVEVSANNTVPTLFSFDPNTASNTELQQLGFSDKNIQTFHKYRSKGGRFRKAEDLKKMFGLKPELVAQLIPYVMIQSPTGQAGTTSDSASTKKYSKDPVELNTADTNDLIALYRIGPAMARRIVDYRNRLGGFLSLEQLMEVYGFDEDILYDLKGKIVVDPSKAHIFDVNEVTAEQLKMHPYFKYKLSNAIVNYRLQHGPYQSLSDLKKIVIVNDSIYHNITRYLMIK